MPRTVNSPFTPTILVAALVASLSNAQTAAWALIGVAVFLEVVASLGRVAAAQEPPEDGTHAG